MRKGSTALAAVFSGFLALLASGPCAQGDDSLGVPAPAVYEKRPTLQETLLATRQRYAAWLVEQPAARQAVAFGPWLATSPMPPDQADQHVRPELPVDPTAKLPGGQSLWTPRGDLVDGKPGALPGKSTHAVVCLTRSVRATRPVRLTVGIGGGDRLEIWLNGRNVASGETHLVAGRYGTGERVDGTRVDQLIVDLDLRTGENSLVVRATLADEPSFYFSPSPHPVPRLWEQLRRDFPAAQNPLLDLVHASWFEPQGWFAAQDMRLEEELIQRLADECGDDRASIRSEVHRLKQAQAGLNDRGWLDLCVKAAVLTTLRRDLARLRAAVAALGEAHPGQYPAAELLGRLDQYERRVQAQAALRLDPADDATRGLMAEMPRMQRRMLVDLNPWLRGAEILFVKRYTYNSKHFYDDFQHIARWGGNLCVLSLADGRVREVAGQLAGGVFDRYDLSFDARRIVFGYRRPKPEGFRIWEIGVDGTGLRQVTFPPADEDRRIAAYGATSFGDGFYGLLGYRFWTDDVHPCYLPDGGLCFASTRSEHGVLCTPAHYLACTNLFRVDAAGGNLRPLSRGALSEFTPTMMEDGRILYNRWEYVYKGIAAVQPLWVMRPDGSGSEEFYGDNIANPGVFWQARQVPGHPRLAVCIGCGHEPLGVGQVLLLDLSKNKRTPEPMMSLTPNVRTEGLRGLYQLRNGVWREDVYGPFYSDPYPLSEKFFLVSCNPDKRYNDETAYGIYLLDVFGNRVPIYHDPSISSWQPMPLRPRRTPPALPSSPLPQAGEGLGVRGPSVATLFLQDVHRGLDGVSPGTVKYLRVMEQVPKPWSAEVDPLRGEDRSADGFGGHLCVSWNAHIWVAVLHGIVPVYEDGSACFTVPAGRNLFFQALDKDFMEVQRMRTFINLEPGEARSCIGCHEHRTQAPASRPTMARTCPPAALSAQPGEVAPRPLDYPADVQPILDRHCVRCHDGGKPWPSGSPKNSTVSGPGGEVKKAPPDLRGELTTLFNRSYENLMQGKWVNTIQEWNGGDYAMMHAEAAPPYTYGSHRSRLVELLKKGHYDADLSREDWIKLVTWIDCGAPYYGSYFGRRHLSYQGQPDFRPVSTVESACGVPPVFPEFRAPEPLPARLLAWWRLDDASAGVVADASGQGREAKAVNVTPGEGVNGRKATRFDGRGYVECGSLGAHEAISIALWVRPDSLRSAWNPLLFCNDGKPGAVHFSLLPDGTPNVAINTGGWNWTHRKGNVSVADGAWHHVVLVCDGRFGGKARFYVDGKPAGEGRLSLGRRLDLDGFRLGAWNGWQDNPANNFHGQLTDVRVYAGALTPEEAARLVADQKTK